MLEVGAGTGTLFECLLDREHAVGLEIDPLLAASLRTRFDGRSNVTVVEGNVNDEAVLARLSELDVDSAVSFNVFEHIEDDRAAFASVAQILPRGSSFAVFVPAFPSIFGQMDRGVGHVRRYRRPELTAKLEHAGFTVVRARYVNLPGYVAWFVNGRILRAASPVGGAQTVSIYDSVVVPVTRRIERIIRPPFGQSLFVVGRRA